VVISALYIIGVINGLIPDVVVSLQANGFWGAAFDTFDVSVLVVLAAIVGARLALHAKTKPLHRTDRIEFACFFALLLVPNRVIGWLALTWLALFEGIRGAKDPAAGGAALLFGLIAVSECWSSAMIQAFPFVLNLDARLAGWVLSLVQGGVQVMGNILITGHQENLLILPGCSSFLLLTSAALCFATVHQAVRPGWRKRDLIGFLWLAGLIVILNTIRLALMGLSDASYQIIHGPSAASAFNGIVLLAAFLAALYTAGPNSDRPLSPRRSPPHRDGQL
jgi:hypothetical protein